MGRWLEWNEMFSVRFSFCAWLFTELAEAGWISVELRCKVIQWQGNSGICLKKVCNELVSGPFLVTNNSAKVLFITFPSNSIWLILKQRAILKFILIKCLAWWLKLSHTWDVEWLNTSYSWKKINAPWFSYCAIFRQINSALPTNGNE